MPSGTPTTAPDAITPTFGLSALRHAFGISPGVSTRSTIRSSGTASLGPTTALAMGTKINAPPKPENPRAQPATSAVATRTAAPPADMSTERNSFISRPEPWADWQSDLAN